MPKYRVQLKQGSKTMVQHLEAKSVDAVLSFFNALSTAKVTEILKVEYENNTLQPVDDMQYYPVCKIYVANKDSNISRQVIVNNVKLTKNENDVILACKSFLDIDTLKVDSCYSCLFRI